MASNLLRRKILWWSLGTLTIVLLLIGRPALHLAKTTLNDRDERRAIPSGFTDDASKLNQTSVAEIIPIPSDLSAAENQLKEILRKARDSNRKISIAGSRHSMGGHTIYTNGVVLNMLPFNRMTLDETTRILHVQSGAKWADIIPYLNQRGFSVEIMQSNDDFTVGGSISVNCHGWQFDRPPICSSVQSFRILLASGEILECSRTQNPELFSLALGGYGLFGVILDVDLRVVPNERYTIERLLVSPENYVSTLEKAVDSSTNIAMMYGRLCVAPENFLNEAVIKIFHRTSDNSKIVSELKETEHALLKRTIFRGSVESDYGKNLRWKAEKNFETALTGKVFSRNDLLHEPAELFQDHSAKSTDILIECFVPPREFAAFVGDLKTIIPAADIDLLNITVRNINEDRDTYLRYADQSVLALVMLFHQRKTVEGEAAMQKATQQIIDAALKRNGRYYLPYRLHATPDQFEKAYPMAKEFFELKKKYDSEELFQNRFYLRYGKM